MSVTETVLSSLSSRGRKLQKSLKGPKRMWQSYSETELHSRIWVIKCVTLWSGSPNSSTAWMVGSPTSSDSTCSDSLLTKQPSGESFNFPVTLPYQQERFLTVDTGRAPAHHNFAWAFGVIHHSQHESQGLKSLLSSTRIKTSSTPGSIKLRARPPEGINISRGPA